MTLSEKDELLIQRCVDGELSSADTRSLLLRLDSLDSGWKTLACGLLEDRQIRKLAKSPELFNAPKVKLSPVKSVEPVQQGTVLKSQLVRHWWSHPVTSLTLCAMIAFVGGMLIPDIGGRSSSPSYMSADNTLLRQAGATTASRSRQPYQVEFTPNDKNSTVPVYSTLNDLRRDHKDHPLFNPNFTGERQSLEWMVVPVENNKSMLFPVSSDASVPLQ